MRSLSEDTKINDDGHFGLKQLEDYDDRFFVKETGGEVLREKLFKIYFNNFFSKLLTFIYISQISLFSFIELTLYI